jgi:hypothetical protein
VLPRRVDIWGSRITTDDTKRPRKPMIDDLIERRENAIIDALIASERMLGIRLGPDMSCHDATKDLDQIVACWHENPSYIGVAVPYGNRCRIAALPTITTQKLK